MSVGFNIERKEVYFTANFGVQAGDEDENICVEEPAAIECQVVLSVASKGDDERECVENKAQAHEITVAAIEETVIREATLLAEKLLLPSTKYNRIAKEVIFQAVDYCIKNPKHPLHIFVETMLLYHFLSNVEEGTFSGLETLFSMCWLKTCIWEMIPLILIDRKQYGLAHQQATASLLVCDETSKKFDRFLSYPRDEYIVGDVSMRDLIRQNNHVKASAEEVKKTCLDRSQLLEGALPNALPITPKKCPKNISLLTSNYLKRLFVKELPSPENFIEKIVQQAFDMGCNMNARGFTAGEVFLFVNDAIEKYCRKTFQDCFIEKKCQITAEVFSKATDKLFKNKKYVPAIKLMDSVLEFTLYLENDYNKQVAQLKTSGRNPAAELRASKKNKKKSPNIFDELCTYRFAIRTINEIRFELIQKRQDCVLSLRQSINKRAVSS